MKYTCKRTLTKATSFQTCIGWCAKISFKQDPTDAEIGQLLQKLAASVYDPYASQERSNSLELRTFVWKIAISVEFFQCLLRPTLARPAGLERIANRFARVKLKSNCGTCDFRCAVTMKGVNRSNDHSRFVSRNGA